MRKTLKEELEEYKDKYLRALAELDNYKKRAQREREDLLKYGNELLLLELIPVVDNFDHGLDALKSLKSKKLDTFYKGVELIYNNLIQFLEHQRVKSFSALGKSFNPKLHEAISTKEVADKPPDTIVEEISKGYMLNDRVLIPAKVVVSTKPDTNSKKDGNTASEGKHLKVIK